MKLGILESSAHTRKDSTKPDQLHSAYGGAILVLAGAALWSASSKWNLTHRLGMGVSIVLMAPIIALWAPILRSGVQGTYAGEGHILRCGVVEVEPGPAPVTRLLWCATPVDGAPLELGRRYGMWYAFDPYRECRFAEGRDPSRVSFAEACPPRT